MCWTCAPRSARGSSIDRRGGGIARQPGRGAADARCRELQDLDYAEAISRMNQQMTGLQAAQAAYTRIGQLSLFDYL